MATEKAILTDTQATSPATTSVQTRPVEITFNITFGTLNFTIQYEQIGNQVQNRISTCTSQHKEIPKQKEITLDNKKACSAEYTDTKQTQDATFRSVSKGTYQSQHQMAVQKNNKAVTGSDPLSPYQSKMHCAKRNQQQNIRRQNQATKTQKQKFIKVPPPTDHWQKAVRKEKKAKRNLRKYQKCSYCSKEGHTTKLCWKRINCFSCGKSGHKCARCPFKGTPPPSNQSTKPTTKAATKQMENIPGRPPIGDLFYPSNQALTEENEYLMRVGLIILIRGAPSPNMPQLIATKLRETHGGHLADYSVTEATISPYVITCRNTQARDTIVQSGLYTIGQGQIQFAVHEWRPRFGMGFDPPTHQVWVKVVGLPLQAWTPSRIRKILQRFGQPLHILPYGNEAGHFRDITALVNTKHPRRTQQAYAYREGDYCTQVDIIKLAWRLWDQTFFPPPGFPPQPARPWPQLSRNPAPSSHRSSSSSSTNAPSEPTIDLSSWSPRSHRNLPLQATKWAKKIDITFGKNKEGTPQDSSTPIPPSQMNDPSISPSDLPLITTLASGHTITTKNQQTFFQTEQSRSLWRISPGALTHASLWTVKHADLIPATSHFVINSISLLGTAKISEQIIRKIRGDFRASVNWGNQLHFEREIRLQGEKHLTTAFIVRTRSNKYAHINANMASPTNSPYEHLKESMGEIGSPPRPSRKISFEFYTAQPHQSPFPSYSLSSLTQAPFETCNISLDNLIIPQPHMDSPREHVLFSDSDQIVNQTQLSDSENCHMINSPVNKIEPLPSSVTSAQKLRKKKKRELPTRRSKRLQAQIQMNRTTPNPLARAMSHASKLAFSTDSHTTPLNTSKTIEILQATGLLITTQIKELIEEAAKQDQAAQTFEQAAPTTPLHDPIPHLSIPGTDLFL